MREKLRQLERLKVLRGARERLSEASVAMAAGRLREAEQRLQDARDKRAAEMRESQRAMVAGERPAWRLALAFSQADAMDCVRLEKDCANRVMSVAAAVRILNACRIATEQASVLESDVRGAMVVERERRAQAESDDRFLARSRWGGAREGVKPLGVKV